MTANRSRRYPSVTTILNAGISAEALKDSYARRTAERAVNEPAELSLKLRTEGTQAAINWLKDAPVDHMRKAANAGKDLHDLADRYAKGEPLPEHLHPDTRLMLHHYLQWITDEKVTFHATEMTVVNHEWGYVGAFDALCGIERYGLIPVVVDAKTGVTGPWPKAGVQLSAYAHCDSWWPGCPQCQKDGEPAHAATLKSGGRYYRKCDHVAERPAPDMRRDMGIILKVRPTGYQMFKQPFEITGKNGDTIRLFDDVFRACLTMYRWSQVAKKSIQGPVKPIVDDTPYLDRANRANSLVELHRIWSEAASRGAYTERVHQACVDRKSELEATR